MLDTSTPGTPDWWLNRLIAKQLNRLPRLERLHRYAVGDHDLPEGDVQVREAFARFQRRARSNYTGLVAESVVERMRISGFRAGTGAGATDDADAWRIWQANRLDADMPLVIRAMCYMGEAYMMVGPPSPDRGGMPLITPEDPRQMVVELDALDKRKVIAALKVWPDDVRQEWRAVLILPTGYHAYTARREDGEYQAAAFAPDRWVPAGVLPNPIGKVPVVRFANRPDLYGNTTAEHEDVMDIQDRINGMILDRLVTSKMQAYRQRWIKGIDLDDEDGGGSFRPGADLVWVIEEEEAEFGEFQQADLRQMLEAVKDDVRDMAAISRTPPHYLLSEFVNAGGDAFSQSETGHVAKVTERMTQAGESAEDVIAFGFAWLNDPRANALDAEVIWSDPQYRSLAEKADAAIKLSAAGIPWRTVVMSVLGYSPQEADRMESERASDALTALLTTPQTPALPAGGGGSDQ
ncbi:phage portal protein [Streptomyces sp. SM12]|uniref:phage portal protein n=1 Tax=Streptomyces sp. SM12 TaxID=1071602 RepID=UPI000CD4F796|nr:phage portal protein [Streptomyces sp. SM12]